MKKFALILLAAAVAFMFSAPAFAQGGQATTQQAEKPAAKKEMTKDTAAAHQAQTQHPAGTAEKSKPAAHPQAASHKGKARKHHTAMKAEPMKAKPDTEKVKQQSTGTPH